MLQGVPLSEPSPSSVFRGTMMTNSQMRASGNGTQPGPISDPPEGERRNLNSELWHACAGPLVSLPAVGSRVIYLPQGHSEQVAVSTQKEVDAQIPAYPNLPPQIVCQLHDVILHADMETDEVYCQMTLQPIIGPEKESFFAPDIGSQSRQPTIFFCKTLTASDTSTHGGFSIPRRAAEKVFPPLDFTMQPPAQQLTARDLHDTEWKFRHIYRGQPKRHLLTTGWSVFVSAKRLVAGDSVLFIRNDKGQHLLGIRRATRPQTVLPSSVLSSDSMHIGVLAAAAHAANTGSRFTVFYNPRASPSEFVIPLAKFEKAVHHTRVSIGMRFRMLFETEESSVRRYMGTITGISDLDPVRWPNSHWRSMKVGWDESTAGERQRRVSLWEIEPLTTFLVYPPTTNWRLKHPLADMEFDSVKRPSTWMHFQNGTIGSAGLMAQGVGINSWLGSLQPKSDFTTESDAYNVLSAAALHEMFPSKQLHFQQQPPIMPPNQILYKAQTQSQQESQQSHVSQMLLQQQQQPQQVSGPPYQRHLLQQAPHQQPLLQSPQLSQLARQQQLFQSPHQQQLIQPPHQQQISQLPRQQQISQLPHQQQTLHQPPEQPCQQSLQSSSSQESHLKLSQKVQQLSQEPQRQALQQLSQQPHQPLSQQPNQQLCLQPHQLLSQQPHNGQQLMSQHVPHQQVPLPGQHKQPRLEQPHQLSPQPSPSLKVTHQQHPIQQQQQTLLHQIHQQQHPQTHYPVYQQQPHHHQQQLLQSHLQQVCSTSLQEQHQTSSLQEQQHYHLQQPKQEELSQDLLLQSQVPATQVQSTVLTQCSPFAMQGHSNNGLLVQQAQQHLHTSQQQRQDLSHLHALELSQSQLSHPEQPHHQQSISSPNAHGVILRPSSQPQALLNTSVSTPQSTSTESSSILSSTTGSHALQSIFGNFAADGLSSHPNAISSAQSLTQPLGTMSSSEVHPDSGVPWSWVTTASQLSNVLVAGTKDLESTCVGSSTDNVVLPTSSTSGTLLISNALRENPQEQPELHSNLQGQTSFGVNMDLQNVVIPSSMAPAESRSYSCSDELQSQYSSHLNQVAMSDIDIPFSSSMLVEALEDPYFLQTLAPVRTYTKVYKNGSVGRSLDVNRFSNYDELRCELARMFGLEGQLDNPRSGWQLIFVDKENDLLLLGDDPWEVFVNNVRSITILSPLEVSQMQDGMGLLSVQKQTCSSSEDGPTQQDSRNPSSVITSTCSFEY